MKIILPQNQETPIQEVLSDKFKYRYTYARSHDSKEYDDVGQDYLILKQDSGLLVFALCDGVSQSFYGDLAARMLGDSLVNWLTEALPINLKLDWLRSELNKHLLNLPQITEPIVSTYPIPDNVPQILRSVLEEKRHIGSETTFVCGRVDLPNSNLPKGRIIFAWLGDSRLRIWEKEEEVTFMFGNTFETMQRWSTKRGTVGSEVHLFVSSLTEEIQITRFAAYSDGFASFDGFKNIVLNEKLEQLIELADKSAASDDISFVEVIIDLDNTYTESPWSKDGNKLEIVHSNNENENQLINLLKTRLLMEKPIKRSAKFPGKKLKKTKIKVQLKNSKYILKLFIKRLKKVLVKVLFRKNNYFL